MQKSKKKPNGRAYLQENMVQGLESEVIEQDEVVL
jgi:hypothetical protein